MIKVFYWDLPPGIHGASMNDSESGIYLVAIDSKQCDLRQRFIFGHELAHVFLHHHDSKCDLMENEAEANREAWNYYRMYRDAFIELQSTGNAVLESARV